MCKPHADRAYYEANREEILEKSRVYRSDPEIAERARKRSAAWYAANKERRKAYNATEAVREKAKEYEKKRVQGTEQRRIHNEANRKYRRTDGGKLVSQAHCNKRRAQARNSPTHHSAVDRRHIFESNGWLCALCGCNLLDLPSKSRHLDHIVPLSKGGSNGPENLQPACQPCNNRKASRLPEELP